MITLSWNENKQAKNFRVQEKVFWKQNVNAH